MGNTLTVASKPAKRTWFVAYSEDKKVTHYGYTEPDQETVSGQPFFKTFDKEEGWKSELKDTFKLDVEKLSAEDIEEKPKE